MPTVLADGCVLIPHLPNWREKIQQSRRWQTGVETGTTLAEDRQALRQEPLYGLSWAVMPYDQMEHEKLAAAVRAAKKEGNAAVPWWGRGLPIGAVGVVIGAAGVNVSALVPEAWLPAVGDLLFCAKTWATSGGAAWEIWEVAVVTPGTLGAEHEIEMVDPVGVALDAGEVAVWPLLRGQFSGDEVAFDSPTLGTYRFKVEQPMGVNPGVSESAPYEDPPAIHVDGLQAVLISQDELVDEVQIDGLQIVIISQDEV